MTSPPAAPNAKEFSTQPTCYSNASSSTYRSSISLKSLKHVANSFGLLQPRRKPTDVEQQSEAESSVSVDEDETESEDDGSIFPVGGTGPYKTKVRMSKCAIFQRCENDRPTSRQSKNVQMAIPVSQHSMRANKTSCSIVASATSMHVYFWAYKPTSKSSSLS
jgi:hypothetical protein